MGAVKVKIKIPVNILYADSDYACFNSIYSERKWVEAHKNMTDTERSILFRKTFCDGEELIFPEHAARVSRIVQETNCCIIWSSAWRKLRRYSTLYKIQTIWEKHALPYNALIGVTPCYPELKNRGEEIRKSIDMFNNGMYSFNFDCNFYIRKAAIVDDDYSAYVDRPECKFFHTTHMYGLNDSITESIINYFNKE